MASATYTMLAYVQSLLLFAWQVEHKARLERIEGYLIQRMTRERPDLR